MTNPDKTPKPKRVKVLRQTFVVTVDCVYDLAVGAGVACDIHDALNKVSADNGCRIAIEEKPFRTPTVEVE